MLDYTIEHFQQKAIGIIDWDYKDEKQLSLLKDDRIFSLNVLELENVLMDIDILEKMKEHCLASDDGVTCSINVLMENCKENISKQATKHTSNLIVSQIKSSLSSENREFERFKQKISEICNLEKMEERYIEHLSKLQEYINTHNYQELYKIFDFNHEIDRFVKKGIVDDYKNRVIRLINNNSEVQKILRSRYFFDIPDV